MDDEKGIDKPEAGKEEDKTLGDLLSKTPGAPSKEVIDNWKTQYGDVFVSGFSEEDLFVWRPIRRGEFKRLQNQRAEAFRKAQADAQAKGVPLAEEPIDQARWEEVLCETVVLWPSVDPEYWKEKSKAGVPSSLCEQIMNNSHFMTPQAASMLVQKL